jgi:hypothetical protein
MRIRLLTIALIALLGCEDGTREGEKKAQAERVAKVKAENDAETALMKSPNAIPELQKRLSDWLTVSDGVAVVVGESYWGVYALPAPKSWVVSCSSGGITVEIMVTRASEANYRYEKSLTRARLSNSECRSLAAAVGKQMQDLLGKL